ncbi:MAG: hypothetical protein IKM28_06895 [Lachnospiraceae bacterium]|nr:hypothetical protein [Lachnospiraceae bacterium]
MNEFKTGQKLALAAMLLGILAIVTTFTFTLYLPFIFGSLAILLAILSREAAASLRVQAIAGIVSGAIGLCSNILIIAITFSLFGSEIMRESARIYDEMVEEIYGISSEEMLGESMEEKIEKLLDK